MKRFTAVLLTLVTAVTVAGCVVPLPVPVPVPMTEDVASPTIEPGSPFETQRLAWVDCGPGFECATAVAPLDWSDLERGSITLNLAKVPARGESLGTLFVNPGGPGASGTSFLRDAIDWSFGEELNEHFDIVAWDPRGVESSSAVECFDDEGLDEYLFGDPRPFATLTVGSDEWIDAVRAEQRAYAEACAERTGELLAHVDTLSTVRDLNLLRELVGDERLHYLGFSYGTAIGSLYAQLFPERVGRVVLDGAISPDVTIDEVVLLQQRGFEASARAYLDDCLTRSGCPFSGSVDSAMEDIGSLIDRIHANPIQAADGRWISSDTLITAIILPLYNPDNWPLLDDLFNEIMDGDTFTAQYLADFYYGRDFNGGYEDNSTVAFSAINCLDYPRETDVEVMRRNAERIADAAPIFGRYAGFGELACLDWPHPPVELPADLSAEGADPILVLGTTGDPATPYEWAVETAQLLPSGVLVTFNGEGHLAYAPDNRCIADTVHRYLVDGIVPARDPNC